MDSKQRVMAALTRQPYDRVPVFPQVGDHAGRLLGYDISEMFNDSEKAVKAHLEALALYRYDVVTIQIETSWPIVEACGGEVTYPAGKSPWITKHPLLGPVEEIADFQIPDFSNCKRVVNLLAGTEKLKAETDVPVAAFVTGPLTMGFHLFGYEDGVKVLAKNKEFLPALTRKASEIIVAYARLVKEAGADLLVICEHDAQMVSPMYIKKFCLPHLPEILQVFDHNILHACGKVTKHFEINAAGLQKLAGLSAVSVGSDVDMAALRTALGGSISVIGNIDHINLIPNANPLEIARVCGQVVKENKNEPGFMLAPGCEITVDTPSENVKAFVEAAKIEGVR